MENNHLTHHGIKGMRWGIRRTPEQLGRIRGHVDTASGIVREAKNINNSISNIRSHTKRKSISQMSDSELKERVKRLNLEQQYSQLTSGNVSRGENYVRNTLEIAGSALAITSSAIAIAVGIKQLKAKG